MKIQFKSDLHLDATNELSPDRKLGNFKDLITSPEAEVLVLAGDIVESGSHNLFTQAFSEVKIPIIYVPGNHEYWGGDIDTALVTPKLLARGTNVHVLSRDFVVIYDTIFIGATLWTPLNDYFDFIKSQRTWDMDKISGMDVNSWRHEFELDFNFIKSMLENPKYADLKKVVVTHFLPSFKSVPERFVNSGSNIFFASSYCEQLMESLYAPFIWVHGHTHDSCDYTLGNTRVICNPYGYFGYELNQKFNPELVIEV